jgi:hypothetical protein
MRTRLFAFIFSLLAAVLLSGSAFADNMTFVGPSGNNSGGEYTYPYNFMINGVAGSLMCDAFDYHISNGETWMATENSIPGGSRLFDPTGSADYLAAGLIFDTVLGVNGVALPGGITANSNDANWAIWALFSGNALADINTGNSSSPFGSSGNSNALAYYNWALAGAGAPPPNSDFAGIIVYTPVAGSQSGNLGTPQEFLGYTPPGHSNVPEPSELSFLGILALAGAGGFAFRKQLAPNLAIAIQQ